MRIVVYTLLLLKVAVERSYKAQTNFVAIKSQNILMTGVFTEQLY